MWGTPEGYNFRKLMDHWEEVLALEAISKEKQNQIHMLIDAQNFVLFFMYEGSIFGATEGHRVTYARMKKPDEETPEKFSEEANFVAINLTNAVSSKPTQRIFYKDDLPKIKIIDRDNVFDMLVKQAEKNDVGAVSHGAKAVLQFLKGSK